jgi:hypothetical protein
MRYVYSIVRFVPDPTRGEFINVGVIVGSDQNSDWKSRRVKNPRRAERLDDRGTLKAVWRFLDRVDENNRMSESELKQLFMDHRSIVQLSPPTPMVASSAEEALDNLFEDFIVDPVRQKRQRIRDRRAARSAIRNSYRNSRILEDNLQEKVTLQANQHVETVDFAVTDGRVVQLTHTWSFPTADDRNFARGVRGWGYAIRDMRQDGGIISTNEATFEVGREVDIEVVFTGLDSEAKDPALQDALGVFEDLQVQLVPLDETDRISKRALELLASN